MAQSKALTATSADASSPRRMIEQSHFQPPRWGRNAHLQTIWPALFSRRPRVKLRARNIELPDGDFLALFHGPERAGPVVLILHGLGGSAASPYAAGLVQALSGKGLQTVVMQYRGAGGRPNRLPRFYHAGETSDVGHALSALREHYPGRRFGLAGFSLGGAIILNYLAESGSDSGVAAAAAVSVPFDLDRCAEHIASGFARVYQWDLLRGLKRMVTMKFGDHLQEWLALASLSEIQTLRGFDQWVTAPLHGFDGATDYYRRCSPRGRMRQIATPTLIVHSRDDPFVPKDAIPSPHELSQATRLELSDHGGHVGFLSSSGEPWLDTRLATYLAEHLTAEGS